LEERVRHNSYKLSRQFNLFQVLDKGVGVVDLFQGDGALGRVSYRYFRAEDS
jgi:hypothetical protein